MSRHAISFLLLVALAGCGGGPDEATLKQAVGERIAEALPPGTVTFATLTRRGSQTDAKAPAGETRRFVYYDADLRLERDYDFGAWDSPGVAGIVSALGTGPRGLTGIATGGNKKGDVVRAHGTALYKREGDKWVPVVTAGFSPATAPAYATSKAQGPQAILEAMRKVIESVPTDGAPAKRAVIEEELTAANATIRARLARLNDGYPIAAGQDQGQYLRFVQALSDQKGARTVALVTRGGEENIRLLRDNKVSLALAQGDAALDAYEGKGSFKEDGPFATLRAIGSLYPEPVHIIVRADASIASVADLTGRRISVGEEGSASRTTALRVLAAHGLGPKDIVARNLGLGDALVALRQKEVDAVIQVIGMPADRIRDALAEIPLRLVPLSPRAVASLAEAKSGYFAFVIPRGAYATQKQDVPTIATAALLLAGTGLSDAEVVTLTRFVYEKGRDFTARGSAQGTQVGPATARLGLTVPQNAAAVRTLEAMTPK